MTLFQSILLGIIQGLTEFLPISSTAHLLLTQELFGWKIPPVEAFTFDVLVQLGTLVSLVIYFRIELWTLVKNMWLSIQSRQPFTSPDARLGWQIILATLPAVVAGILLKEVVERLFGNPGAAAAIRLMVTAALLWTAEGLGRRKNDLSQLTWYDALWIGVAQVLSILPGASRSGSTIAGGMTRQLDRPSAARFSFLMSVPVMIAAGAYQSLDLFQIENLGAFALPLAAGFLSAALVGYLAIRWLLAYLVKHPLYIFATYCTILGAFCLVYSLLR